MRKSFLFILFFGYLFLISASLVNAFQEDFSQGFSKWQLSRGEWNYWSIENGQARVTLNDRYTVTALLPKDQYWFEGDEYEVNFEFTAMEKTDKTFAVGVSAEEDDFYDLHFYAGELNIEEIHDDYTVRRIKVPAPLRIGEKNQIKIIFRREEFKVYLNNQLLHSLDESWFPIQVGGKFALRNGAGYSFPSTAYYDNIEIHSLLEPSLPHFKQTDPLWAGESYDHSAGFLENPDIIHWGCALTSASILLHQHGLHYLPSGLVLNPKTLNDWLKNQQDGYIAQSLVNWLALTRLVAQESKKDPSIGKLEFQFSSENSNDSIGDFITDGKAVIAQVPGHFLFIEDFDADMNDFLIIDPFYDYQYLSQSQPVESLRVFSPSNTDLSYFLFLLPDDFQLTLFAEDGEILDLYQEVLSTLLSDGENSIPTNLRLLAFQKPTDQRYQLKIIPPEDFSEEALSQIKLYSYDSSGELSIFNLIDYLATELDRENIAFFQFQLTYQKEDLAAMQIEVEIQEKTADEQIEKQLKIYQDWGETTFDAGEISFYHFYQFFNLIEEVRRQKELFPLLDQFLKHYSLEIK